MYCTSITQLILTYKSSHPVSTCEPREAVVAVFMFGKSKRRNHKRGSAFREHEMEMDYPCVDFLPLRGLGFHPE